MVRALFKANKKTVTGKKNRTPGFLEGITVQDAKGNFVYISDLWKNQTVILKLFRRFGCPLCRYESRLLSELRPEFDEINVKLAAVGFEKVGLDDFLNGGYWDWDILVDEDCVLHKLLDVKKVSVTIGLKDLMSSATKSAILASRKSGIYGDFNGDGFQLGGTFIIEKVTGKLLYEYRQLGAGYYTSLKELYSICGGDPDEIEEKAPVECIHYQKKPSRK